MLIINITHRNRPTVGRGTIDTETMDRGIDCETIDRGTINWGTMDREIIDWETMDKGIMDWETIDRRGTHRIGYFPANRRSTHQIFD